MGVSTHRLTGARAAAAIADLGAAAVVAGPIARRRPAMRLLERMQADERAVSRIRRLRAEFGRGPVELAIPGRRIIAIIDPEDVGRVLDQAPTPFDPANWEKRKALRWFQPHGVLITQGPIRAQRRAVNEEALDSGSELHRLAGRFADGIADEAGYLITDAIVRGQLNSEQFIRSWWRLVRRLTLGERARDDERITDRLLRLRKAGNWSFLSLPRYRTRSKFLEHLHRYAEDPEEDTLLGAVVSMPAGGAVDPVGQLPHWLFAFDAAGMATLRTLALLATHPEQLVRAGQDADTPNAPLLRSYLRACVLESLRLWPTTPAILRDTTEDTCWRDGDDRFTIAEGAGLAIIACAFHRDASLLPFAHQFSPDIWLDGRADQYPQLVPFSAGPAGCPGRNLVLFVASSLLAHLLSGLQLGLISTPRLSPAKPLPMTFNHSTLQFAAQSVDQPSAVFAVLR